MWSCPTGTALRYPARYLFAFLANHGMLSVTGPPPWRTVTGGSRRYVELVAKRLLAAARHPWSTAAVSVRIRCQGVRLYLRGLPVIPRPAHQPQEGAQ